MNTALVGTAKGRAIMPEGFEDVQRIAKMAVASGLFKTDRNDDDATRVAKATMAIMQGLEIGLPPMQALQCIAIINGRCLVWGDAVPALLWANGFKLHQAIEGSADARTARCTITRPDGDVITRSFSVADAKRARLWDERTTVKKKWNDKWEDKPNDSPWFRFPDRMLGYRALGFASRDGAADVLRGLRLREEDESNDMVDITPIKSVAPSISDIPDEPTDGASEPLADEAGALAMIQERYSQCESEAELAEIKAEFVDLIARMSPEGQFEANRILNGDAE